MNASIKHVACPHCGQSSEFTPANPYRPFCSERCKMIDLGAWASEQYAIETPIQADLPPVDEQ
jgi:endogenous inhibitor of DNA gyrase (YacG/DUF329 family)